MHSPIVLKDIPAFEAEVFCELCCAPRPPTDEDWEHHSDEVEEVEISWVNGDQGVVTHFPLKQSFDLCSACTEQYRASKALATD